jgi:hypothetical protein
MFILSIITVYRRVVSIAYDSSAAGLGFCAAAYIRQPDSGDRNKTSRIGVTQMAKLTHDTLRDLLDALAINPVYTTAAAGCGVSTKSLWRWLRASQCEDDPASFKFVWSDVEDWFHNHLKYAMKLSALMIEATARHHALHGFDEVQVFQGKVCWKENPKLAGLDDEALEMLGYQDRYEHNPDGSLIPLTVRRKPSDQLVLKMLAAHFPRTYGDKVEHQHNGIIAVMRVGRDGKWRPNSPAKLEDQSDELVMSADSGDVAPMEMKIGLVVPEPLASKALEVLYGGKHSLPRVEFVKEDGSVERVSARRLPALLYAIDPGKPTKATCTCPPSRSVNVPRRRFLHLAAGAAAVPATSRIAMAQAYPTRPVRFIVPVPPGGAARALFCQLCARL